MGHFYSEDGTPRFTILGKNGKIRPTTIRDARKEGWLSSVTTILGVLAKPELDKWKQKQCILASLTLPRNSDESDDEYVDRIIEDAFKQVDDAADMGTRIHAAIENHFQGKEWDQSLEVYVNAVDKWVSENGIAFLAHEQRLINPEERYAGTTDGIITHQGKKGVCDFKSRRSKPEHPMKPYSTELMQIAAYAQCIDAVEGVNIYVSTTEPGRIEAVWYDQEFLKQQWEIFRAINRAYQLLNKLD